MAGYARG